MMAGHGSKLMILVVAMLMAITSSHVEAVDIQGFNSATECAGSGYTFSGIGSNICTVMNVGNILIRDLKSSDVGKAYRGGGCTTQIFSENGPTVWCFLGGSFTGALWIAGSKRKLLESEAGCTSTAIPDGVHYTPDLTQGSWVLKTPNAAEILAELNGLDDAEKVAWLMGRGAYHVAANKDVRNM